jgi:DNA-binding XRE family transcriptional regulator
VAEHKYQPISHDHTAFMERALRRKGFRRAYDALDEDYSLIREMLVARLRAGLTQEQVAAAMGTTKSVVSRLEAVGRHSPSLNTLTRYAKAVGCQVVIRLIPTTDRTAQRRTDPPAR